MTTFNWGILGTGNIAKAMSDALKLVPNAALYAVASRTEAKANTFAQAHGITNSYGSYADLYADPNVDIVYVGTPNACHKQNILDALAAGKHVMCEKPMTLSVADSQECFRAAEAAGLFLMEALWTAFCPAMIKAIDMVQSGDIGTPHLLVANFISKRSPETYPILFDPALGGGARNDLGIYPVAAALLLAGAVEDATSLSVQGPTGVDEMTFMTLKHCNGTASQLACGFRLELPIAVRVEGSLGCVEIPEDFNHPQRVILYKGGTEQIFELPTLGTGYAHEAIHMQNRIRAGHITSDIWSEANTLNCAKLLEVPQSAAD